MRRFRVTIPYTEQAASGRVERFETVVELEAQDEAEARKHGLAEFNSLAALATARWDRSVISREVRAEPRDRPSAPALSVSPSQGPGGVTVFSLRGVLDSGTMSGLEATLASVPDGSRVVVELSRLEYISSTGLALLAQASDRLSLAVAAPSERVARIVRMVGLDRVLRVAATVQEAAARME